MSVKRRNVRRRRKKSLSLDRREKPFEKILLYASAVLSLAAVSVIGIYVYQNYLKGRIIDSHNGENIESESAPENEPEETTVLREDPYLVRKREAEELERRVLLIEPGFEFAHFTSEPTLKFTGDEILDEANRLAAGYDYDAAIALIKSVTGYGNIEAYTSAAASYQAQKTAVVPYVINNNITHVFFHSLIVDPTLTFDPSVASFKVNDYNDAMTTVSEFAAMLEEMYRKGYVLVDIYDVAKMEQQPDGTEVMTYQKIMLPEGKIPFILSIDDTNYYEYMDGHGFPSRLVVTEDGRVQNEMILTDGSTVTGSFDVIPILEDFIDLHPDFSYRGGRGIAGITGYNGVLGYRTSDFWYDPECPYYEATDANNQYRAKEISGPNPDIQKDKETARAVAEAIKDLGWRFASHTWGHKRLGEVAMTTLVWDSDMWQREVEPILGETDLLIFPYGNDFGQTVGWKEYEYEGYNERYETMKSYGFDYFFNVDSSVYFMQRTADYFRQGRRNLDGERMWEAVYAERGTEGYRNRLSDLFDDVSSIIDPLRPEPEK